MLTDASRLSKSRNISFLTGRNRDLQNSKCKESARVEIPTLFSNGTRI